MKLQNSETENTKVLIIKEHFFKRYGLMHYLQKHFKLQKVDLATDAITALNKVKTETYDLIFIDLECEGISNKELCDTVRKKLPRVRIIALSNLKKTYKICDAIDHGVSCILPNNYSTVFFNKALSIIINGGKFVCPEVEQIYKANRKEFRNHSDDRIADLSRQEKKIVLLLCEQLTSHQISDKLGLSKTTVDTYKKRILKKLDVVNSVGIAVQAIKSGLYTP